MRKMLFCLTVLCIAASSAIAQSSSSKNEQSVAELEDMKFEDAIRDFGFVSGAAYQCIGDSDKIAHQKSVLNAYNGLVRLFGSDRAFFYASAFGSGAVMSIDKTKCKSYLDSFKSSMQSQSRSQ